jgi:hypothetical protein
MKTPLAATPNAHTQAIKFPDPVYAMIESHKAISIAYDKAVNDPAVGDSRHPECAKAERISDRAQNALRPSQTALCL